MSETVPLGMTGYLAAAGFEAELRANLEDVAFSHDRLLLAPGPPRQTAWAQNVWIDPVRITFGSIKDASRALRALGRSWALYSFTHHRRAQLIQDELPHVSAKPLVFPDPPPAAPLGSWTLIERDVLLAAPRCTSAFPHGEVAFVEDHVRPPSRAYLKLWEAFTLLGVRPQPGQRCLDLGASPGGWTWVLAELGARVFAVDKAPLAPDLMARPEVEVLAESAFALSPSQIGPIDWFFSDVVCYPERLLRLIELWRASGLCQRFVCTIKLQGATDHQAVRAFTAIPGSRLMHLSCNKHELTWVLLPQD